MFNNFTQPISPMEVLLKKNNPTPRFIPAYVFDIYNKLIEKNFVIKDDIGKAIIYDEDIINAILKETLPQNISAEYIIELGYLDVVEVYTKVGWDVSHKTDNDTKDKSFQPFFVFVFNMTKQFQKNPTFAQGQKS